VVSAGGTRDVHRDDLNVENIENYEKYGKLRDAEYFSNYTTNKHYNLFHVLYNLDNELLVEFAKYNPFAMADNIYSLTWNSIKWLYFKSLL